VRVVCVYVGTYMCVCEDDILLQILGDEQQIREDIQIQLFHTRRPQQFRVTWLNLRQCSSLNDVAITSHQWHRLQQMHIPSTTNWLSQGLMSLSTQNRVILETSFKQSLDLLILKELGLYWMGAVRSFVIAGRGPAYCGLQRWDLYVGQMRQPRERRGIGRCVRCMCQLCRVEEGLSRREQLVRYF